MGNTHQHPAEELSLCSGCPFRESCLPGYLSGDNRRDLESCIDRPTPVHAGTHVVRQGQAFQYIGVLRLGTLKSYSVDRDGREQTLGFHMPGDVIGLSAIDEGKHPTNLVALDTVMICRVSFSKISELAARAPKLQSQLFKLLSRDIGSASKNSGNHAADERFAAFLLGMANRFALQGFSARRWQLSMSRMDIASYLCLTPETISRLFKRFQKEGLLAVEGRDVELKGRDRLEELASPVLNH